MHADVCPALRASAGCACHQKCAPLPRLAPPAASAGCRKALLLALSLVAALAEHGEARGVSADDLARNLPEDAARAREPFASALSKTDPRDRLASNLARRLPAGVWSFGV